MRYDGFDIVRGLSAFFIVGCHIALLNRTRAGTFLTHYCDTGVAVFAALSGFLFAVYCTKKYSGVWNGIIHRTKRLLPLYALWSIFYIATRVGCDLLFEGGKVDDQYCMPSFWLRVVVDGAAACHLWFFSSLWATQVLLLLLFKFARKILLNPWVMFLFCVVSLVGSVYASGNVGYHFMRVLAFSLLGWWICVVSSRLPRGNVSGSAWRIAIWAALVASLVVHPFGVTNCHRFYFDALIVMPLLFLCVLYAEWKSSQVVGFFSSISLGVYLWHPFFAVVVARIVAKMCAAPYSWSLIFGVWILVYAFAVFATVVTRRIGLSRLVK